MTADRTRPGQLRGRGMFTAIGDSLDGLSGRLRERSHPPRPPGTLQPPRTTIQLATPPDGGLGAEKGANMARMVGLGVRSQSPPRTPSGGSGVYGSRAPSYVGACRWFRAGCPGWPLEDPDEASAA